MKDALFSGSSYVDIATNFAHLDSIDFSADFQGFLEGTFQPRHLLTLLHETTHHWCLTTALGSAMAALTYRTYQDAACVEILVKQEHEVPGVLQERLDEGLLKSRMSTSFLVPLLEGLALYAEWRATPIGSVTYSRPFDIYRQFARSTAPSVERQQIASALVKGAGDLSPDELNAYFEAWALTPEAKEIAADDTFRTTIALRYLRSELEERTRLEDVFKTPLDPRRGSYQLGYLFACGLERICWGHRNTDLFLAFMRDHFFNDPELAVTLLDDRLSLFEMYGKLRERLQQKVFALLARPAEAKDVLDRWAETVPYTRPVKQDQRDFLGLWASKRDSEREAFATFDQAVSRFFDSPEWPSLIPPDVLKAFVLGGRTLTPLGAKDFTVVSVTDGRLVLRATDGQEMSIRATSIDVLPPSGVTVTIGMLVNVNSPGTAVSLRWEGNFAAMSLDQDTVSAPLIRAFYEQAEQIASVVRAGQRVLPYLYVDSANSRESVETRSEMLEQSPEVATDVLQIYRGPIVVAFTKHLPAIQNAAWREAAMAPWQPNGVLSLLGNPALVRRFLRVSGMVPRVRLDGAQLIEQGYVTTEAAVRELKDQLFEAANAMSAAEYAAIVAELEPFLDSLGVVLFAKTVDGETSPLI